MYIIRHASGVHPFPTPALNCGIGSVVLNSSGPDVKPRTRSSAAALDDTATQCPRQRYGEDAATRVCCFKNGKTSLQQSVLRRTEYAR